MSNPSQSKRLYTAGFISFLLTQFLGVLNDNIFKMTLSLFAKSQIAMIGAVFIIPYILFSGYAGYLADIYNKRAVMIATKLLEVAVMGLTVFAFYFQSYELMLVFLFFMALQSTLFSPAKYGIMPEMLHESQMSRGNGLLEMSTFVAIIIGTTTASILFTVWENQLWLISIFLFLTAIAGYAVSIGITKVPASGSQKAFRLNPWSEIGIGLCHLYENKPLWLTVMGITYFWFLGALFQMALILIGGEAMGISDLQTGLLFTFLALGIGAGSLAAGKLSGDKIEMGLVPIGSIGMGLFCILIYFSTIRYELVVLNLILLGFFSGIFSVPLYAFLQQNSGEQEKGRLIATSNFINTIGILFASIVLFIAHDLLHWGADFIMFVLGCFTLAATAYIVYVLPEYFFRMVLWIVTHTLYRVRVLGLDNVPAQGPALLVCNHVSYMDGILIGISLQRYVRFMIYRPFYEIKILNPFFRLIKLIPVSNLNRKDVIHAIRQARIELQNGELVCIFAEGAITRTGNILPFQRGFEKIVEGLDVPIIPVHLDQLWGSIFSFAKGKVFLKFPRKIPYPVTITFGEPKPSSTSAADIRLAVMELSVHAVQYRQSAKNLLHSRFIQTAKKRWSSLCLIDSLGKELTYSKTLIGSMLLANWIKKNCADENMIGLLLPSTVPGAIANIASHLAGKVPVNLNFTAGTETMQSAVKQCEIKTIITSKLFITKAKLEEMEGMVFLEDVMKSISITKKTLAAMTAYLLPSAMLIRLYRYPHQTPDSPATVLFSSGSTGQPKGVMLSHFNILSNIDGFQQLFDINHRDTLMGVLPFFHAFGFTICLWFPVLNGFRAVYHPNPIEAQKIGELIHQYQCTVLLATSTFIQTYTRKCSAEEMASLRYVVVGAEKLRHEIAEAFQEKYGLPILEGYGCTELGPTVSVNVPNVEVVYGVQNGTKFGSVGHPIPGVAAKIIDPETKKPLPYNEEGLLLIKSSSMMMGYLEQPQMTEDAFIDGWYNTGDIAKIDEDGFIWITDRLSRFSKIGGEMVPHIRIEEVLNQIAGEGTCVITSAPDAAKGERLVVLYTNPEIMPKDLWQRVSQSELPNLWIPKQDHFFLIESLPVLGSGKLDLRELKKMAAGKIASTENQ